MSEFLVASADVIIRPDTRAFRATLEAELLAATRGVAVAIPVAGIVTAAKTAGAGAAEGFAASTVAAKELAASAEQAVHPLAQMAASLAAVDATTSATVKVSGDYLAASRALTPSLAAQATASQAAAVAANEQLLATKTLATASATTAGALQAEGAAAGEAAVAERVGAVAATEAAAAHEQLARGAGASTLSLLGVRGATLAASAPFLAGAAAVTILAKSIRESSKEQEAAARVSKILGAELGAGSVRWAHTLANSFELSATSALKFEGAFAEVLHNAGLAPARIAPLSERLVKLAADMAAFNNVPVDQALKALQLAISGNLRGLRLLGVTLTQAEVKNEALAESGKKLAAELTRQDLVQARLNLIYRDTANQVGTVAERSGNLAGQSKILQSNLANLAAQIGTFVTPAFLGLEKEANNLFIILGKAAKIPGKIPVLDSIAGFFDKHKSLALAVLVPPLAPMIGVAKGLDLIASALSDTNKEAAGLPGVVGPIGPAFQGLVGPVTASAAALRDFEAAAGAISLTNLQQHLLDLQFIGASSAKQIADLQGQVRANQQIIRAGGGTGGEAAVRRARADRNRASDQIKSIQAADKAARDKQIADAKAAAAKAAADAKAAAAEAQRKLDEADRAFLDALGLRRGGAELRLLRAQGTKSLQDDIRAQEAISVLLQQAEVEARKRIHNVLLLAQTEAELVSALETSRQATKALQDAERQAAADRRKLVADRAAQRTDLDIQIAQTNKNINAEIRAREAKIRLDREQEKTVHGDIVRLKQLQLDVAQQQQAIKDLKKQKEKENVDAKALQFAFLQAQQGFAATLLSNLLPSSATKGTVGGISTPTIQTPSVPAAGPGGPGRQLAAASAVSAAGAGGVTAGQASVQTDLLRQIVRLLRALNAGHEHPEAHRQRVRGAADMAHPV